MKLSIITINRNNAAGLRNTMESVFSQSYHDFEYIVVDGASTDGSVDVIKEFAERAIADKQSPAAFTWLSESDTGIYNAMNKGCKMAKGEFTLMLNSADTLVDAFVIEKMLPELQTVDMIQGNIIVENGNGKYRNKSYAQSNISFFDVLDMQFLHQAIFIRRDILKQYGYYDESYKLSSDSYFFITALGFGNATYKYVNIDIANFDMNGISGTRNPEMQKIGEDECTRWFKEHVSNRLMEMYRTAPKKIRLYDTLHSHKLVWYITMGLIRMAERLAPSPKNQRIEKI